MALARQIDDPRADVLLDKIRRYTAEIDRLEHMVEEVEIARTQAMAEARDLLVTTKTVGQACGISGVAVTMQIHELRSKKLRHASRANGQ
jgi:hypothetical protein